MIQGLERFRAHFEGHEAAYLLIGGVATQLVLDAAGLPARATKDLDIVLCAEALDEAFVGRFWDFIALAGYQAQETGTTPRRYYHFHKPKDDTFPAMLELFSRRLDDVIVPAGAHLTPIPTTEDLSSLSAILIDDDLYGWLLRGRTTVAGVAVVSADHLIALKVRAYLDLSERQHAGATVDSKDIRKHRSDVLRLLQLVVREPLDVVPAAVRDDATRFVTAILATGVNVRDLKLAFESLEQALDVLAVRFGTTT